MPEFVVFLEPFGAGEIEHLEAVARADGAVES